jgi:aspartyl protease family protein
MISSNMMISIILLALLVAIGAITALVLRKRQKAKANKENRPLYRWNRWEPRKLYTDDTVKLGWGMITAAWLLVLGLLYVFFDQWMEHQNNPNRNLLHSTAGAQEMILERNRSGHYIAPGTINGQPVTFMLDTGATLVAVPANQGPALNLTPGAYGKSQTANGVVDIRFTKIKSLTLGPFHLREVQAALNPGMNNDEQILLGMSVLKHLEFTQQGNILILRNHTTSLEKKEHQESHTPPEEKKTKEPKIAS